MEGKVKNSRTNDSRSQDKTSGELAQRKAGARVAGGWQSSRSSRTKDIRGLSSRRMAEQQKQ